MSKHPRLAVGGVAPRRRWRSASSGRPGRPSAAGPPPPAPGRPAAGRSEGRRPPARRGGRRFSPAQSGGRAKARTSTPSAFWLPRWSRAGRGRKSVQPESCRAAISMCIMFGSFLSRGAVGPRFEPIVAPGRRAGQCVLLRAENRRKTFAFLAADRLRRKKLRMKRKINVKFLLQLPGGFWIENRMNKT